MEKKFRYSGFITSRFNPCVIDYSAKSNLFIVGTYQLIEKDSELFTKYTELESKNFRVGTLELIDSEKDETVEEYECQFGGVFDLRLVDYNPSSSEQIDHVAVAHANGILALYQILEKQITLLIHWKTSSSMLTTVQDYFDGKFLSLIGGGANGQISHICLKCQKIDNQSNTLSYDECEMKEFEVTEYQHPIWYIRTYQIKQNNECLLFVGSEDSKWRIYSTRFD